MGSVETRSRCQRNFHILFSALLPIPPPASLLNCPRDPSLYTLKHPCDVPKEPADERWNVCIVFVGVSGYFKRHLARLCVV